jgi:hypothetical protein
MMDMLRRDVRPVAEADNRVVAEGEDGYCHGTPGLPVGLHLGNRYLLLTCLFNRFGAVIEIRKPPVRMPLPLTGGHRVSKPYALAINVASLYW